MVGISPSLRRPAVAVGSGFLRNLGHDGFRQAVGGDKLGPVPVQRLQADPARGVDGGHLSQIDTAGWFALAGQSGLPARNGAANSRCEVIACETANNADFRSNPSCLNDPQLSGRPRRA